MDNFIIKDGILKEYKKNKKYGTIPNNELKNYKKFRIHTPFKNVKVFFKFNTKRDIMKKIFIKIMLIIGFFSYSQSNLEYIQGEWLTPKGSGTEIKHSYYSISYVEKYCQSEWVYYQLTAEMYNGSVKRTNNFRRDPDILGVQASLSDYKRSGFDRGHLVPAKDMSFSRQAMSESFYLSNISPQRPGFNRGIWKKLEYKVRNWALGTKKLHIVTGGILSDVEYYLGGKVAIPKRFYKIIYDPKEQKMVCYLIHNQKSYSSLNQFIVSVDSVEKLTGIDFFWQLPDELENRLER